VKIRTKRYVRTLLIFVVMFLAGSLLSRGQPVPAAESPVPARTYHLLREDDDWSFLADPAKGRGFWEIRTRHRSKKAFRLRCATRTRLPKIDLKYSAGVDWRNIPISLIVWS
jgi:hypothetical protein